MQLGSVSDRADTFSINHQNRDLHRRIVGDDKEKKGPGNDARHEYCPRGKDSWCKYQRDQATDESPYKTINIPEVARELIKPIFAHMYFSFGTSHLY